ncbi:MAG: VWA domain-containing protein, partial [Trueperaceae bacterium]
MPPILPTDQFTFLGVTFAFPLALLGLALLALVLRRRHGTWWLRALTLVALVLALAQPWLSVPGGHLAVVVDVSDSVGGRGLQAARTLDLGSLEGNAEVVLAGSDALRATALPAAVPATLATGATDLSRALQVAVANGASRVLLVSDGITAPERLLTALPSVPVDVLIVPGVTDLRLQELLLPSQGAPGQLVEGVAVIRSDRATEAQLHVEVGGAAMPALQLTLPPGESAVPFQVQLGQTGSTPVRATVTVDFDQPTSNDTAAGEVSVRSRPPVLVIGDPAFAELLRVQGIDVVQGEPSHVAAPLPYGAVVVRGSSGQFTTGQLELLRDFVDGGGGLLMTGGPESFGFGAWYRTAVEEVLPVTTDLRTEVALPLVALVMVIDRSQSMASGRPAKIELAKEGALQVVELAYQEDLLGLIAFSDGPGTSWVFELRQASERGKLEMAQGILSIGTSGGTVLEPAYAQALEALAGTQAAVKHVIILS